MRMLVARIQTRACRAEIRVVHADAVRALQAFARRTLTPFEVEAYGSGFTVQLFLLPDRFGEAPRATIQEIERQRAPRRTTARAAGATSGRSAAA